MIFKVGIIFIFTVLTTGEIISEPNQMRLKRSVKFWDFLHKVGQTKQILFEQYNDTLNSLNEVYNVIADGFSDTATTTRQPKFSTTLEPNSTTTTTTERYRISRREFGRILGRNQRGLQKLFRIELADALNQSRYNILSYKREFANAIAPHKLSLNASKT